MLKEKIISFVQILIVAVFCISSPIYAQNYSPRDASYVTISKNVDVLSYIICLENRFNQQPRRLSQLAALNAAEKLCRANAVRMPRGGNEPSAADIKLSILECGFRLEDASPDMGCVASGSDPVAQGPFKADVQQVKPEILKTGKWLEGIAFDGTYLWATESGQRTVAQFEAVSKKLIKSHKVGRLPISVVTGQNGVTFSLIATDKKIVRHDARGNTATFVNLNGCASEMILDRGDLWVLSEPSCSSETGRVTRVNLASGKKSTSDELGEWVTDITAVNREIWVSHSRGAALDIVNRASLNSSNLDVPGMEIWALTANSDTVFGGGRPADGSLGGLVVSIDASKHIETARVVTSEMIFNITSDARYVYAVGENGTIWIYSTSDLQLLRTIVPTVGTYSATDVIIVKNRLVVAAGQFQGENGAMLSFAKIAPPIPAQTAGRPSIPSTTVSNRPQRPRVGASAPSRPTRPQTSSGQDTSLDENTNASAMRLMHAAVGTYESPAGPTGNIILTGSDRLTWSVFCGTEIEITHSGSRLRLLVDLAPPTAIDMIISNDQVTGFLVGNQEYTKLDAVMMPGCAGAPVPSSFSGANQDFEQPEDPRALNDYSLVPKAQYDICDNNNVLDKGFYDCMDQELLFVKNASDDPGGHGQGDPRANNEYSSVSDADWQGCQSALEDSEAAFYDCVDAVVASQSSSTNGTQSTPSLTKEPGWDRETVFYQPAHDYCVGTRGLSTESAEYSECYYSYK